MTERLEAPNLPGWLERMVPFHRYGVPIENQQIHVMEHGRGPRTVLCLHGNPTWGFLYRKVAAELDPSAYRVVMPDLVGLGFSSRPAHAHAHTLENHGRWMGKLIEALDLREYILVVQDWGGAIGMLAAARAADRAPRGVVLLNTAVGPPRSDFKSTTFHAFAHTPFVSDLAFRLGDFPQRKLSIVQGDPRSITGAVQKAYRYPLRGLSRNAAPLQLARMVPDSMDHPSIEPLGRSLDFITAFQGPIDGVWGDRDPVLGSVGRYLEKLLPQMRMIHTNGGHFLQEEVPGPIARAIEGVDRRAD